MRWRKRIGRATSVRRVRRDLKERGPTESDTGRSWFLPSSGCNGCGHQWPAHWYGAGIHFRAGHSWHVCRGYTQGGGISRGVALAISDTTTQSCGYSQMEKLAEVS